MPTQEPVTSAFLASIGFEKSPVTQTFKDYDDNQDMVARMITDGGEFGGVNIKEVREAQKNRKVMGFHSNGY